LLFLGTLLLPSKYLAKLTYFAGGFLFWHVIPVIAALPPSELARLPPPFSNAPTDTDYAMELISQRVAAGLPVKPKSRKRHSRATSTSSIPEAVASGSRDLPDAKAEEDSVDWKKWGERAAVGKAWADDGKRLLTKGQVSHQFPHSWFLTHPSVAPNNYPGFVESIGAAGSRCLCPA
jgi:hypothetical protein